MTDRPRLLAAAADRSTLEELAACLGDDATVVGTVSASEALAAVGCDDFDGVVVDGRLAQRMAGIVGEAFLRKSQTGRVVLLTSMDDPDTLMRLRVDSGRVEVIFRPWNEAELRTCLLRPAAAAMG